MPDAPAGDTLAGEPVVVETVAHATAAADPVRYEAFARYLKDQGLIQTARPAADYLVRPQT